MTETVLANAATVLARQNDPESHAAADAINAYLNGDVDTLDAGFGVRTKPGNRKQATRVKIAKRDALLRKAAADQFPNQNASQQARSLHREISRYASSGWHHECTLASCPSRHAGNVQAAAWSLLTLEDRVLSERRIREILATS